MSRRGIALAAKVFSIMQEARTELLRMGCRRPDWPSYRQDIELGQMLEGGKEAMKWKFAELTAKSVREPCQKVRKRAGSTASTR